MKVGPRGALHQAPLMKQVFLTGASSGIGLAIATELTARGHEVWGTARDITRLPKLPRFHRVMLDLSDSHSTDQAFRAALAEAGHFDVLINNAGSGHFDAAEDLPTAAIVEQFQILFFAPVQLVHLGMASMRARGGGLIINVTSLASRLPVPFMGAYNAAKAAMAAFTLSMQLELPDSRVRIVDLQPADICTRFNDAVRKSAPSSPPYEAQLARTWEAVERNMKAAPKPELVARGVCALIDRARPPARVTIGDAFQSKIAPLILRVLPQRLLIWGLRTYYRI